MVASSGRQLPLSGSVQLIMSLADTGRPARFDERQGRDDFLVRKHTLIGRHSRLVIAASQSSDPKLGQLKKLLITVMPRVACRIVRWRPVSSPLHRAHASSVRLQGSYRGKMRTVLRRLAPQALRLRRHQALAHEF